MIASSHTCLPVALDCSSTRERCVLINNGAAGMPNFSGTRHGVIARIALQSATHVTPLYATCIDHIHIEALALHYDHTRWRRMFLANWPPGTAAHESYYARIEHGPRYALNQAVRWRASATADALSGGVGHE